MDEYEYLQPGFDPKSLTVPRLRSIFVAHDIQYPATAKKPQLIELFNDELLPQAKKILAKQARAKRSSKGIVDMPSYNESESFDDHDLAPPPPRTTRSRSPRKASTRLRSEEYEPVEPPATISPTKRKVRASSRQPVEPEPEPYVEQYVEPEPPKSVRTKRVVTPHIKTEESEEDFFKKRRESEYFSKDNPFQSGSSPAPIKTPATGRRRTTEHKVEQDDYDYGTRRQTDGHYVEDRPKSSRKSQAFEVPVSKLLREETPEFHSFEAVEAGEEFTPDAQFEMEQEMAASGETAVVQRQTSPARPRRSLAKPFWALAVSLLGAYGAWYRQEKVAVGYCGLGRPATQIIPPDVPVPDWAVQLAEPQCEPCPQHAYCYEDFSVRCEPDFILKPHPLALGGLVPLPPTCEPDGEKVRRVKAVADKTVEELRERRAQFECGDSGDSADEESQTTATPQIDEEKLKEVISSKRSKKMNKEEFDDLWVAAIGDVKGREEVEVVPLSIGSMIFLIATYFYVRSKYRSHKATAAQVPALVDLVLSRLATQKELGEEEIDDPWLFLPNLRDDVLRSVHSLGERDRIWKKVKAVVEQNSNVRTSQREGRSGEVGRAWEWIGPIAGDSRRRKSGRTSFGPGPDVKIEDSVETSEKANAHSKWEEPRPIY
ncbi:hypothetical protein CkaCkLH20_02559 [Colletotrichum karsti]|uniref:Inner nuclear membrane protein SRC1 n=1 Tax=Colletotrichum karsti TaxID=1095194 RepID=A0A9P6LNC6_9PEZI|nr:uncharacterized protein CkaCkLH20_02559 [Colletotrichum karsti]KAF9879748.1 hypothetical protein CkaCkLH20_02559 [Colletotrichum karsti]